MSDDLSQLDELIESDVLEALGETLPTENSETVNDDQNIVEDLTNTNAINSGISENIDLEEESIEDIGDIEILPMAEIESALDEQEEDIVSMNSSDLGSLANILSKLLNNKTIEITIKVKD